MGRRIEESIKEQEGLNEKLDMHGERVEQDLFEVGTMSRDQELPSPGHLMLTFKDDPDLPKRLQKLNSLQDIAATCASPPGLVTMGSAILAPYQVSFPLSYIISIVSE